MKILNLTRVLCLCVLVSLFYDVQCFTAQNIDVNVNIVDDVAGNGNASNNGIGPFNQSPIGNTITINSTVRSVYGSWYNQGEVSSNVVNVSSQGFGYEVYGGRVSTGTVSNNRVNYYNNSNVNLFDIYGAYIDFSGKGLDNVVNINVQSWQNGEVYGAYIKGSAGPVLNNVVDIHAQSWQNGEVYGAYIKGSAGPVLNNVVDIHAQSWRNGKVYGAYIGSAADRALDNVVNINVQSWQNGEVKGCYALGNVDEISRNIVNINVDNVEPAVGKFGFICGAHHSLGAQYSKEITDNKVTIKINSGGFPTKMMNVEICGAYIQGDKYNFNPATCKMKNNQVIVDIMGSVECSVSGALVGNGSANAYNNSVIINNGNFLHESASIYGASIDRHGDAVNNNITINNGTFKNMMIIGGITSRAMYKNGTGNAVGNTVTINGGTVSHNLGCYYNILGGSSGGGNSISNNIIINGGTINANRIFAAESDTGSVTDNTVTIQKDANVEANLLCGGFVWTNPDADMFTGNTLNLKKTGTLVNGLDHFENYNFWLQKDEGNIPMITVRIGGQVVVDKMSAVATGGAINLENTNIGVYVSSDVSLSPGEEFVLIKSTNGITGNPKSVPNFVQKGVTRIFGCNVDKQATQLVVKLTTHAEVCPMLFQGYNASIAFSNFGADLVSERGMQEIIVPSEFGEAGIAPFMVFSGKNVDYGSKSQVKVTGISMLAGVKVKEFKIKSRPLTMGIFCEHGNGNFDSKNDFNEIDIKSKGAASYVGGGLLGRAYFKDNVYCEASLRIGQIKGDYNSADLKDVVTNLEAKYDYSTLYFGSHLGSGYIHKFSDKVNAELYGKYVFLKQDAKEVILPTEEKLKFFGANSHRVQLGARFNYLMSKHIDLLAFVGGALEHEFDGQVKAVVENIESTNSNLKGSNVVGEIGLRKAFGQFNVGLGVQGYSGNKSGLYGELKASYTF